MCVIYNNIKESLSLVKVSCTCLYKLPMPVHSSTGRGLLFQGSWLWSCWLDSVQMTLKGSNNLTNISLLWYSDLNTFVVLMTVLIDTLSRCRKYVFIESKSYWFDDYEVMMCWSNPIIYMKLFTFSCIFFDVPM